MKARNYKVTLTGISDLLPHKDNLEGQARLKKWQLDPKNKKISVKGDDRSPGWTWTTYCYHNGKILVVDADVLMSMLKDGGKRCSAPTGKGSMKAQTQSGIIVNELCWPLLTDGKEIPWKPIEAIQDEADFEVHEALAKSLGFTLFPKRCPIGTGGSKHVRVRPRIANWSTSGTVTIMDQQITGEMLQNVLDQAGFYVGLMDWRPGAPKSPGQFGRFEAKIEEIK